MLKIKDNVDLKELEKFGFEKDEIYYCYYYRDIYNVRCIIGLKERLLVFYIDANETTKCLVRVEEIIFDLIQAGLVEKVGGEK